MKDTSIALGLVAAAAAAFLLTRKRRAAPPTILTYLPPIDGADGGDGDGSGDELDDHPICKKYASGNWMDNGRILHGTGWSLDDVGMVESMVASEVGKLGPFNSLSHARELSFTATRAVVAKLCKSMKLPKSRATVENYLKTSVALRYLWQSVDTMVWNDLVGDPGGSSH